MGLRSHCAEWRIDAFEELEEDGTECVPVREQLIKAGVGELDNKPLGAEF